MDQLTERQKGTLDIIAGIRLEKLQSRNPRLTLADAWLDLATDPEYLPPAQNYARQQFEAQPNW